MTTTVTQLVSFRASQQLALHQNPKNKLRRLATEVEKQRNLFCPNKPPKRSLGGMLAIQHVHTGPPICIPKNNWRSAIFGQHAICFHKSRILLEYGAVRFYFGGFSSTAGYVPGNEAQDCS